MITGAGQLPARHVIHTVGPMWSGDQQDQPDLLASAYRRSLEVTVDYSCQSVAFPSLSTGAYGYPLALTAGTALRTVMTFLREHQQLAWVRFVLFDPHSTVLSGKIVNH